MAGGGNGSGNGSVGCIQILVQGPANQPVYNYVYPLLLAISFCGNSANILVYTHPFLRTSPTVRLLSAKAIANLLTWFVLIPTAIYVSSYPAQNFMPPPHNFPVREPALESDRLAAFYWRRLNVILFVNNFFSSISVWLTVAVTAEHFVLVVLPVLGRSWSNMRNAHLTILLIPPFSVALHAYWLISVSSVANCRVTDSRLNQTRVSYFLAPAIDIGVYTVYSKAYSMGNSCVSMLLPLVLLVFFSAKIYRELGEQKFQTNTEQKRCVVRLALATTVCHFLFEVPGLPVFVLNAIYGTHTNAWAYQEQVAAAANCLSQIGSSIYFFVYLLCSPRFRTLSLERFGLRKMDEAAMSTRRGTRKSLAADETRLTQIRASTKSRAFSPSQGTRNGLAKFEESPSLRMDRDREMRRPILETGREDAIEPDDEIMV